MEYVLALETTEKHGSIALLDGSRLLAETVLPREKRSAQTLAPAIDAIFHDSKIEPRQVALVAVVVGPGSFTGLRVGVATAKIFAYATGAKIEGIDTFTVVVQAHADHLRGVGNDRDDLPQYLSVAVDAQRGEVLAALYERARDGKFVPADDRNTGRMMSVADWWKQADLPGGTLFSGPALERWSAQAPKNAVLAKESLWFPQASVLGKIAAAYLKADLLSHDCYTVSPVYSRLSAAEERLHH